MPLTVRGREIERGIPPVVAANLCAVLSIGFGQFQLRPTLAWRRVNERARDYRRTEEYCNCDLGIVTIC